MKDKGIRQIDGIIGNNNSKIIEIKNYIIDKEKDGIIGNNALNLDEVAVSYDCGIIELENHEKMLIKSKVLNKLNISREDEYMKKSIMYDVLKEQLKFLMTAVLFIITSLIGITVFIRTGRYLIHPYLYIIMLFMGIGWGATAIFSIKSNRV